MERGRWSFSVERDGARVTLALREVGATAPRRVTVVVRVARLAALVAQLRCAVSDAEDDWSSTGEIEVESCSF